MNASGMASHYHLEANRLQSYHNWPASASVDPLKLAKAGFYYTGQSDSVRCFCCRLGVTGWLKGDDPMSTHRRWSSRCQFVMNQLASQTPSRDVCGPFDVPTVLSIRKSSATATLDVSHLLSLGLLPVTRPINPEFASFHARLRSFDGWPVSALPSKGQMAEAGLYCVGKAGWACCYHCNIYMMDWKPNDDPWIEHARWSPNCYFVLTMKGLPFVRSVTHSLPLPLTREVTLAIKGIVCCQMPISDYFAGYSW